MAAPLKLVSDPTPVQTAIVGASARPLLRLSGISKTFANGVKALSTMPGLPELRARLLGLLQAPATQLVRLLGTPATQTVRVLKAHQDKLEGQ